MTAALWRLICALIAAWRANFRDAEKNLDVAQDALDVVKEKALPPKVIPLPPPEPATMWKRAAKREAPPRPPPAPPNADPLGRGGRRG